MTPDDPALARLDAGVLAAHARHADAATLAALYREGGDLHMNAGHTDAACFAYTHAYVYALEAGDFDGAEAAGAILRELGRLD